MSNKELEPHTKMSGKTNNLHLTGGDELLQVSQVATSACCTIGASLHSPCHVTEKYLSKDV